MKKLILAATLLGSCALANAGNFAANNGRVAILKANEPSRQEAAAIAFFQEENPDATVFTASNIDELNASDYDCLWIHIDRKGIGQGFDALPEEFRNAFNKVKSFYINSGNLYLSGFATQFVERLGVCNQSVNVFSSGDGGNGWDKWTVSPVINNVDQSSHHIYAGLEGGNDEFSHNNFGLLWGGGPEILREDHNCLWNGINSSDFENAYNARILGQWGQNSGNDNAGIVEFYPTHNEETGISGTIIVNGLAAYQWYVENGTNAYADNMKKLTANVLAYLASNNNEQPDDPYKEPETFEDPDLGGNVALWMPFAETTAQEAAAVNLFKSICGQDATVINGNGADVTLGDFACIWLHIEKDNIAPGWTNLPIAEGVVAKLKQYHEAGGNIYLSKQAVQLVNAIERTNAEPTEWNNLSNPNVLERNDKWQANIAANGQDWTGHTIFNGIEVENIDGRKVITLLDLGAKHYDRNIMWKLNDLGGHDNFCSTHNARVLGTWGHEGGQAFAGIVEFFPNGTDRMRAISKDKADARKGTIIANGLAAYHLEPLEGSTNPAQGNINKLTSNILAYLAPAVEDDSATSVDFIEGADETPARWFTLQGIEVQNPTDGLYIKVQGNKSVKVIL